jgi:hypothetical protein
MMCVYLEIKKQNCLWEKFSGDRKCCQGGEDSILELLNIKENKVWLLPEEPERTKVYGGWRWR